MRPRIEKRAETRSAFLRRIEPFPRARDALRAFIARMAPASRGTVLLPAYVGWSPREGSGVFDPLRELAAQYAFYRVDRALRIDLDDIRKRLESIRPGVVLLIHYFGFPDPAYREVARLAREAGALVVEDEAHALFSDLVGGACGRAGNASLFSLHKMLPVPSGGLLVVNDPGLGCGEPESGSEQSGLVSYLGQYDLASIAAVRVRNATFLTEALAPLAPDLEPLRPELPPGVIPQTLPVILKRAPRDEIYRLMNEAGFGVVSLYHSLIAELSTEEFPDSYWLSRRILNLPVHQDTTIDALAEMVDHLQELLARWS